MVLRMKNFNIFGVHWKIQLLGVGSWKTNIEEGGLPKKAMNPNDAFFFARLINGCCRHAISTLGQTRGTIYKNVPSILNFVCESMTCHVLLRETSNGRIWQNYQCFLWSKCSLMQDEQHLPQGQIVTEGYQCFSWRKLIHGNIWEGITWIVKNDCGIVG